MGTINRSEKKRKRRTERIKILSQNYTHTEIHAMAKRALPEMMCLYRHAIVMHKLFNEILSEEKFLQLNFQFMDNDRSTKTTLKKDKTMMLEKTYCSTDFMN